jgi:hypothetical protein
LVDNNTEAIEVMARRLAFAQPTFHGIAPPVVPTSADDLFATTGVGA